MACRLRWTAHMILLPLFPLYLVVGKKGQHSYHPSSPHLLRRSPSQAATISHPNQISASDTSLPKGYKRVPRSSTSPDDRYLNGLVKRGHFAFKLLIQTWLRRLLFKRRLTAKMSRKRMK
ncbi:hypothetical protein GGR55DRAFT_618902 [Xylaria sp. FL0064]|nr:hypothetical protein GGR55DRAFT_618902 [Xylaria sp. FL0064]